MENAHNMKPVHFCTGFIFCMFPAIVTEQKNYHRHFKHTISLEVLLDHS